MFLIIHKSKSADIMEYIMATIFFTTKIALCGVALIAKLCLIGVHTFRKKAREIKKTQDFYLFSFEEEFLSGEAALLGCLCLVLKKKVGLVIVRQRSKIIFVTVLS